ncbi:serine carboxypeptidase [Mollisia scopiformis]|uniref:Carboxypeptidase n=1 Tax=Mollisia scopiformis TaxID=149040 RepID=A0A194WWT8_MOLSC|nr:serine carboxypeptidase [Mollisia scopiformis]KUJ12149.1 serine carboxypeptidase [Mollisia scopiformis]
MNYLYLLPCIITSILASKVSQAPLLHDHDPSVSDFTTYQSEVSSSHSIRVKRQNATLCDTPVDQYTGWLDVGAKHLFFWYFKAENAASDNDDEPLALWLTGGPGGSSMLGMLQELGPCLINKHGNGTVYNPFGWNKETALIFVDQPAGVGFSYLDEGEPVPGDSFTSAADMHLFLQVFVSKVFPEHKNGPLVITGESYAGHYLPALGAQIVSQNILYPKQAQVPLKSLAIGNGYVSPLDTAYGYWETLCTTNPGVDKPIFNETICDIMATNLPRCIAVAKTCYDYPDPAICNAAAKVCWDGVIVFYDGESYAGGRNRFDITAPCDLDEFCYPETELVQDYLNLESSFNALGVPKNVRKFEVGSHAVEEAFQLTEDLEITMKPQLEYLLANQIDVLIYQGNLDLACNTAGAKRWTANMPWKGQSAFTSKELKPWKSTKDGKEVVAGTFKEVNVKMMDGDEKTTRFALVTVDGSGHMVPMDQPEISLDMLNRWLAGKSFD